MTPFVLQIDYLEPFAVLLRLAQEPGICFLDSAKRDKDCARYSYLGVDPFEKIQSDLLAGNPFDLIKSRLSSFPSSTDPGLPPFQGGALGVWGYELVHHLEDIPRHAQDEQNIPDRVIGLYDVILAWDHLEEKSWIISQGFPEKNTEARSARAERRARQLLRKIQEHPPYVLQDFPTQALSIRSNFTPEQYKKAVQQVIDYIVEGDIFQANISQCFSTELPSDRTGLDLYGALRQINPAPFSAFLQFDDLCLASASPERFIQLQGRKIQTRPIKGTRPRGKNTKEDQELAHELLASEKDRAENIMIVDLLRNDLSRVSVPESVQVKQICGLESFETVHHLVSVIEAELLSDLHAMDLLKACFPGGSITGAPKIRAMEIIAEIEPWTRGAYCGSIGWVGFDGNMDTSIVIRTFTVQNKKIYFQAGGGIVADSVPETEYQESLTKSFGLKKVLLG